MIIPAARIIRRLLITLNHGTEAGAWPIYAANLPASPDSAIAVYDTAGLLQGRIMRTGEQIKKPGIQIRVRGIEYLPTFTKVQEIADALDTMLGTTVTISTPTPS